MCNVCVYCSMFIYNSTGIIAYTMCIGNSRPLNKRRMSSIFSSESAKKKWRNLEKKVQYMYL